MLQANRSLIQKYITGDLDKSAKTSNACGQHGRKLDLAPDQQRIATEIVNMLKHGMEETRKREEADWRERHEGQCDSYAFMNSDSTKYAFAVLGPAGSGKTTAVQEAIDQAHAAGARILIVAPTGRLAASLRMKYPYLEVDTMHGAFHFFKERHERLELMLPFDLIIIEEVGQLEKWQFEEIMWMWDIGTKRLTCLVFVGDFAQLPNPTKDKQNAKSSPLWHTMMVAKRQLFTMRRCKCHALAWKLELLRTATPDRARLSSIVRNHKAVRRYFEVDEDPTRWDIAHVLEKHPQTIFVTVSRRACAVVNDLALAVLFGGARPLACLPTDPESNRSNYEGFTGLLNRIVY